jgi:hypothetical protein
MTLIFVTSLVAEGKSMTIEEIHQKLADSRQSIKTIQIIGFREKLDYSLSISDTATTEEDYKRLGTFQSVITENDMIIDCRLPRRMKSIQKDVRDLNELFKSEEIPLNTVRWIAQNKTTLVKEDYSINMINQTGPVLKIYKEETSKENFQVPSFFQTPYFGIPDPGYFTKEKNLIITECTPLVCVDVNFSTPEITRILRFELDPVLGYRLKSFKTIINNVCTREIIADDYRNINGIPYPFIYKIKSFNPLGQLRFEENFYAEKVAFNKEFKEEDFRMFVPPDTEVSIPGDSVTSDTRNVRTQKIKGGCYLGVDDILQMTGGADSEK